MEAGRCGPVWDVKDLGHLRHGKVEVVVEDDDGALVDREVHLEGTAGLSHLFAGDHESNSPGFAHEQTNHGGFHALSGEENPHGTRADFGRCVYRSMG